MKYITSDLHFSHESILKWTETRPFSSAEEMDNFLLCLLNNLKNISGFELLYHVGDFYLGKKENLKNLLDKIEIPIVFIFGNHDKDYFKKVILDYPHFSGHNYLEIKENKEKICLFHFPIMEWNQKRFGTIHLHGHLHGTPYPAPISGNILDVGFDKHQRVLSLDEAITLSKYPIDNNCH